MRRRNKYGVAPKAARTFQGTVFASKAEMTRWIELQLLERGGGITGLRRQVRFPLAMNGEPICVYVADFVYIEDGVEVVEDRKGVKTPEFKLKAKMFRAQYGKDIRVT